MGIECLRDIDLRISCPAFTAKEEDKISEYTVAVSTSILGDFFGAECVYVGMSEHCRILLLYAS